MIRNGIALKSHNYADFALIQLRTSFNSVANYLKPLRFEVTFSHKISSEEVILLAENEMIVYATAALVAGKKLSKCRKDRRKLWVKSRLMCRMKYRQYMRLFFEVQSQDTKSFESINCLKSWLIVLGQNNLCFISVITPKRINK